MPVTAPLLPRRRNQWPIPSSTSTARPSSPSATAGQRALAGDGQVTLGPDGREAQARKIRRLHDGQVLAGFAGSTADALALFAKFEAKLEEYRGNLSGRRSSWPRTGAPTACCAAWRRSWSCSDREATFLLSGAGDVIAPDDGLLAVGSGGPYALAAARALVRHTDSTRRTSRARRMKIAADICIYTNDRIAVETL